MKNLFILGFILLSTSLFSQRADTIPYKNSSVIVHYNKAGQVHFYENSYFMKKDSLWKRTYYSKGKIKTKKINGLKISDTLYLKDRFLEINESYYTNGNIKSKWYNKPKSNSRLSWSLDSTYLFFYPNGQISDSLFYVNYKLSGITKQYFETGQLKVKGIYSSNKKEGKWKYYNKDGSINYIEIYKKGKMVKRE